MKEIILDKATEIANIPINVPTALRIRLRRLILDVAKTAIIEQQKDPKTLEAIKNWMDT